MNKFIGVVLLLAGMIIPLFSGGTSEKNQNDGGVTLTFVETMTNPSRTAQIQNIISQYEEKNPNVKINLISPPYEQADNKLTMMLNSNQALDIIEVRDHTVKQYVNNNRLTDLTPYMEKWETTKDLLPLTLAAAKTVNDTPYLIPQFFYIKGLFVRTDVLKKYGFSIPKTIDELYKTAAEITKKAPNQFGYGFRGRGSSFKISDALILANVTNISKNNIYFTDSGTFSFDTPDARKGLEAYLKLFETAVPADGVNWGFNEQVNAFISGTTPFLIQDPDTISLVAESLSPDQYTVVPFPVGKNGTATLDYGFAGLSIPTTSKNKEAAWDFLTFILSAKVNADFCKTYGPLPVHTSTFENDSYFSTGVYKAWQTEMATPDVYKFVKYPLDSPKYPGWAQVQEQIMQSLLLKQISADEAITQWKAYWK